MSFSIHCSNIVEKPVGSRLVVWANERLWDLCLCPGLGSTADEVFKMILGSNFLAKYSNTIAGAQGRGKGG